MILSAFLPEPTMTETNKPDYSIERRRSLEIRLGLSRSTIYDRINPKSPRYDPTFPKPIRLGGGAVGWLAHEVDDWLRRQIEASRDTPN
jgi:prophage regulatory protein